MKRYLCKYLGFGLIVWITLVIPAGYAQHAYIMGCFPRHNAINLDCNIFISASVFYPSEGQQIDPITLNSSTVRLYPKGKPKQPIRIALSYNVEQKTIRLDPREVLSPRTSYVFEITTGLIDDRGFRFMPFKLSFTTGECESNANFPIADRGEEDPPDEPDLPQPFTEMESIQVELESDSLVLRWSTQSEFMNFDFTVDKSLDGENFDIVDRILSYGDNKKPQSYSWQDPEPIFGWNYYRLTLADIYGELTYSDTVAFFVQRIAFIDDYLPVDSNLEVEFFIPEPTSMAMIIKTPNGKIVKRKAGMISRGKSILEVSMNGIPPGTYLVLLKTATASFSKEIEIIE